MDLPITIVAAFLCAHSYRPGPHVWLNRMIKSFEFMSLLTLFSLIGAVANYPLAAISTGWMDKQFLTADAALGLDWLAYWNFVIDRPNLLHVLSYAYGSFFLTPSIIVISMAAVGKFEQAYRFIVAFIIALFITDISLIFFPAKSAAAIFLASDAPNLPPSGTLHIAIIEHLRDGSLTTIVLAKTTGLIALPSFHAAASLIFAWAGWQVRWLRYPCLFVNVLMLLSTPINGGHYFVDVLVGLTVGLAAICLSDAERRASLWSAFRIGRAKQRLDAGFA